MYPNQISNMVYFCLKMGQKLTKFRFSRFGLKVHQGYGPSSALPAPFPPLRHGFGQTEQAKGKLLLLYHFLPCYYCYSGRVGRHTIHLVPSPSLVGVSYKTWWWSLCISNERIHTIKIHRKRSTKIHRITLDQLNLPIDPLISSYQFHKIQIH